MSQIISAFAKSFCVMISGGTSFRRTEHRFLLILVKYLHNLPSFMTRLHFSVIKIVNFADIRLVSAENCAMSVLKTFLRYSLKKDFGKITVDGNHRTIGQAGRLSERRSYIRWSVGVPFRPCVDFVFVDHRSLPTRLLVSRACTSFSPEPILVFGTYCPLATETRLSDVGIEVLPQHRFKRTESERAVPKDLLCSMCTDRHALPTILIAVVSWKNHHPSEEKQNVHLCCTESGL